MDIGYFMINNSKEWTLIPFFLTVLTHGRSSIHTGLPVSEGNQKKPEL